MIAFDNETFLITRERPAPPVVCVSWYDGKDGDVLHHSDARRWIVEPLADPEQHFVGHNVAYDFATLAASYPELLPAIFDAYANERVTDTIIRQQLFDIATGKVLADDKVRGYSLADLYRMIFDHPLPGERHKEAGGIRYRYGEFYDLPLAEWPPEAIEYARSDARGTYEIWKEQETKVGHLLRDDPFNTYTMFVLTLTSFHGMRCEHKAVQKFEIDNVRKLEALRPELLELGLLVPKTGGGFTKKVAPAQERIEASCQALGRKPLTTKAGAISVDRTACHWAQDAIMLRRADYVTAEKMISTYLPFLQEGTQGPITTRFNLVATGRTSSSAPRKDGPAIGGNFQNMPRAKGPRECIIPRPGKLLLTGDFQGAELHCLAQVCKWKLGYSVLGETLKSGKDIHLFMAAELMRVDYETAVAMYKANEPEAVAARQHSKIANFGFGGAMGVKAFIKAQLKEGKLWTESEGGNLRATWLRTFPEMPEYFELCKRELGPNQSATIELFCSPMLRKIRGLSTLCNTYFQSLCAVGSKRAINEVIRRCYIEPQSSMYGMRPINYVHDDLTLEVSNDPEVYRPAAAEFAAFMRQQFNTVVPDYPTGVDVALMHRWSKSAKRTEDAEGNLIPCPDEYLQ